MKYLLIVFIFLPNIVGAQRLFSAKIVVPNNVNEKAFVIYYENGKSRIQIKPYFKDKQCMLSDSFYARYATIMIAYRDKNNKYQEFNNFWVTDKPATITFISDSTFSDPLSKRKLVNAIEVSQMRESKFNDFKANEEKNFQDFYFSNQEKIAKNDEEAVKLYHKKSQLLNDRYLAFIKENGNLYYSFWLFRKGMIVNSLTPLDTLFKIYNTVFPDSLKNSIEGEFIENTLRSRNLKKRDLAPNFNLQDVRGKGIKLPDYKGKHILLTFWASWCGPCIKEIPTLLKIKEKYPSDKLEIISINLDDDSTSFSKAVQKYKMEWVHIFGNRSLRDTYGVMGIPEVFLINKSGEIIYKRGQEKDYDSTLPILNKLLIESL